MQTNLFWKVLVGTGKRSEAITRGRFLEYITIIWNLLEGIISVGAGLLAGSIALIGFGFDSFIESASGGVLLWRLHLDRPERREQAERLALKFVGLSFLLLAAYVAFDAVKSLIKRETPEATYVGIGIAALSLIVMPLLARAKRRVAKDLHSHAMEADARQTDICTSLHDPLRRVTSKRDVWVVVGRPCGGSSHDPHHLQRGDRSATRPEM